MSDEGRHGQFKSVAVPAGFHLLLPAFLDLPVTYGPVDEPAQIAQFKFPCRAFALTLLGAVLRRPAFLFSPSLDGMNSCDDKQELPLNVSRHSSPPLLKTLNGFEGCAKKLGRLNLCLAQISPNFRKLDFVHPGASFPFHEAALKLESSISR
jgi:hypothetical protein